MSYITNTDIQTRLGTTLYVQLADDTGSGSADPNIVNEARLGAEGEANSYLARRYAVPVNLTAHPELTELLVIPHPGAHPLRARSDAYRALGVRCAKRSKSVRVSYPRRDHKNLPAIL